MNDEELALLRDADPLGNESDQTADTAPRLVRIRDEIDARIGDRYRPGPGTRPRRARRPVWLAAAVVAVALVGTVMFSLVRPGSGPSLAGVSAALDSSGDVVCTGVRPEATWLPPAEARLRLLPSYLPTGWKIGRIWVTREVQRCMQTPSLTAAVLAQDGRVVSSVMVRGPLNFTVDVGAARTADTTIDGIAAKALVPESGKGPDERIWLWQVAGKTWFMKSYGFSDQANRTLEQAVHINGDQVRLEPSGAPAGLQVISQRTGPPYGQQTLEEWHVTLGRGDMLTRADGEVWMRVVNVPGGPLGLDGVFPDGQYLSKDNGQWTIRQQAHDGGLGLYEGRPGVVVALDPPWNGGEPRLGSMSAEDWVKVVNSLNEVPSTDPRLTSLWAPK